MGTMDNFFIGIDTARRARYGTTLGIIMDAEEANPFVFFQNFHVFFVFCCSFLILEG